MSRAVRFAQWLAAPKVQAWFNAVLTLVWLIMMPITVLFIGPFSTVLWVAFISAWALFATHLGAWIAALVNVRAEQLQAEKTAASHDKTHQLLQDIHTHLGIETEDT